MSTLVDSSCGVNCGYRILLAAHPPPARPPMPAPTSHAHVQDSRHARLGLPRENVHLPDGLAEDSEAACRAYSEAIRALDGLNLQLLGISPRGQTLRQT